MKALTLLVLACGVAACATIDKTPSRFSAIAPASAEECAIIRAALIGVLSEEPYYSKPVDEPVISYIALSPYLVAEEFEENPYEALKDQAPTNIAACIGRIRGPRFRLMTFEFPEALKKERVTHPHGWVSRPIVKDGAATVLLSRGACFRTATIELVKGPSGAWTAAKIVHSKPDVVWSGRNPCSAPAAT